MKKINLERKLSLKKETITKLNKEELSYVRGGDDPAGAGVWKTWKLSRCMFGPSGTAWSSPTIATACTTGGTN